MVLISWSICSAGIRHFYYQVRHTSVLGKKTQVRWHHPKCHVDANKWTYRSFAPGLSNNFSLKNTQRCFTGVKLTVPNSLCRTSYHHTPTSVRRCGGRGQIHAKQAQSEPDKCILFSSDQRLYSRCSSGFFSRSVAKFNEEVLCQRANQFSFSLRMQCPLSFISSITPLCQV